jgi:hypothetical protein
MIGYLFLMVESLFLVVKSQFWWENHTLTLLIPFDGETH